MPSVCVASMSAKPQKAFAIAVGHGLELYLSPPPLPHGSSPNCRIRVQLPQQEEQHLQQPQAEPHWRLASHCYSHNFRGGLSAAVAHLIAARPGCPSVCPPACLPVRPSVCSSACLSLALIFAFSIVYV